MGNNIHNTFVKWTLEIPSQLIPGVKLSPFYFLAGTNRITHPCISILALRFNGSYISLTQSLTTISRDVCLPEVLCVVDCATDATTGAV
jgi:hypothetical protein